jgi:hypothetical protein
MDDTDWTLDRLAALGGRRWEMTAPPGTRTCIGI